MDLTKEHIEILKHTAYRAARHMYCGDSPEMQELVEAGYMKYLGTVAWCEDKFFTITPNGLTLLDEIEKGETE